MANIAIITALEVGLFEILSRFDEHKSYEEIAAVARLKPRYVKELLGGLAMAGVVDINPANEMYLLPKHRRDYLNTKSFKSLSVQTLQLLPKLFIAREEVKNCFQIDGPEGIPQSFYLDYARQKSEINAMKFEMQLLSLIEEVDGLVKLLEDGVHVVDFGCGAGDSTLLMAKRFPNSRFLGVDFSSDQLDTGKRHANERNLNNVSFEMQNIEELPEEWSKKFDFFFCDNTVHDLANPKKGLSEFHRVLKSSRFGLIIDVNLHTKQSENTQTNHAVQKYIISMLYCVPGSLYFGGVGLGGAWGVEKAIELIEGAGFHVKTQPHSDTISYICRKNTNSHVRSD